MAKPVLLVIDDELDAREEVQILFETHFEVIVAEHGYEGLYKARQRSPQLIIFDEIMPGLSGLKVLEDLRNDETTRAIPVIMRSIKGAFAPFRLSAYQKGANLVEPKYRDYVKEVPKTLELDMLEALVNQFFNFTSNWRVKSRAEEDDRSFFRADILNHAALLGPERRVFLGEKEFKLYYLLMTKESSVATRVEIMRYVYDQEEYYSETDATTINALVNELKGKINLEPTHPEYKNYVKAVRDVGYRLEKP